MMLWALRDKWDGRTTMDRQQLKMYRALQSKGGGDAELGTAYQLFSEGVKRMPTAMLRQLIFHTHHQGAGHVASLPLGDFMIKSGMGGMGGWV